MVKFIASLLAFALTITILIGLIPLLFVFSVPVVKDTSLKSELYTQGLNSPTSMAFLGPKDILVLEKDEGIVKRIINGNLVPQPLLQIPVAIKSERGMLGMDIAKHKNGPTYVFLYYTESGGKKIADDTTNGIPPSANVLYRYELTNDRLINPKLLLSLPSIPSPNHDGGKVVVGPDNNVYVIIGYLRSHRTQLQNVVDGPPADKTSAIFRVTQDGQPVANSPLGNSDPLNLYYAYGIRNSFGIDFDPVTGNLWDTENGPDTGDEINLVYPGFNSGWSLIQGFSKDDLLGSGATPDNLVFFGKGSYAEPKLSWITTIGITALKF